MKYIILIGTLLVVPPRSGITLNDDGPTFTYGQRNGDAIVLTPKGPAFIFTQPGGSSMTIGPDNDTQYTFPDEEN